MGDRAKELQTMADLMAEPPPVKNIDIPGMKKFKEDVLKGAALVKDKAKGSTLEKPAGMLMDATKVGVDNLVPNTVADAAIMAADAPAKVAVAVGKGINKVSTMTDEDLQKLREMLETAGVDIASLLERTDAAKDPNATPARNAKVIEK